MPRLLSRENLVIAGYIALTVAVLLVTHDLEAPPTWVTGAIVIGLGVIAPLATNASLERRTDGSTDD